MSRVAAELWAALTAEEQHRVARAIRITLGAERGDQLTTAIHRGDPTTERCHDCGKPPQLLAAWDWDLGTVVHLDYEHYRARLEARQRAPMAGGDVQQPFPTTMPIDREDRWPA